MIVLILGGLLMLAIGVLAGGWHLVKDQSGTIGELKQEIGTYRQEIQVLNDAIARSARVPIMRMEPIKKLEKSDTYFEGHTELVIKGN